MHRAYSTVELKSIDEDARILTGMASTPEPDRMGDVMVPEGAKFSLPLPLLWQHRKDQPIGHVVSASVTKKGIEIRAQIAKDVGIPFIDEAWKLLKAGLVRGLSIGFRALELPEPIDNSYGYKFSAWEWLELSAVTVPANQHATVQLVKSLDTDRPAAVGDTVVLSSTTPAVAGTVRVVKVSHRQGRSMKKSYPDQIKDFEATRAAKTARMDEIMEKAADEGRTLETEEQDEYDGLEKDVQSTDEHLRRLRAAEERNKAAARAIVATDVKTSGDARNPSQVITVKDTMPGDIAFGAMVLCKAHAFLEMMRGNFITPLDVAKQRYPHNKQIHDYLLAKTAVIGGTTTDTNYAASLFPPAQILESAFLEYLRPLTIVDRFGTTQNGVSIPSLRRVPFNVKIQSQTTGAAASWVGEGKGKPVTKFHTTDTTLLFNKIAAIAVITDELARFSRPGAEGLVRDELARAVVERMDTDFVDPAKAVSSGVNPASITNGLTALTSAGTSAANVLSDVQSLVAPFLRLNYSVRGLVLLMPDTLALTLSLMQNSLGQDSFQGMTVNGGTLAGLPVLTSNYLASGASFGNMVVCLSADNIALADDGNVTVDASREASIQMEDVSTMDATAGTGQTSVSMFQTNSIAIRAEREITWKKLRSTAVVYMDDVNWGSIGSPV